MTQIITVKEPLNINPEPFLGMRMKGSNEHRFFINISRIEFEYIWYLMGGKYFEYPWDEMGIRSTVLKSDLDKFHKNHPKLEDCFCMLQPHDEYVYFDFDQRCLIGHAQIEDEDVEEMRDILKKNVETLVHQYNDLISEYYKFKAFRYIESKC